MKGIIFVPEEESFATLYPDLARSWNDDLNCIEENGVVRKLSPFELSPESTYKAFFDCSGLNELHFFSMSVKKRVAGGKCPYCEGKVLYPGINDMASVCPEALADYDKEKNERPLSEVIFNSREKLFFKCHDCGHEWQSSALHYSHGYHCSKCRLKTYIKTKREKEKSLSGSEDKSLIAKKPWVLAEWDEEKNGCSVYDVPYRAGQSVFWKCFRGHSFKMTMGLKKEGQCPYCSGHKVLVGFNDLKSCNPELASEWDYERNAGLTDVYGNDISTPDKVTCGSGVKVWWHGKCGHFWQAKICDRNLRRGKCPYCRDR